MTSHAPERVAEAAEALTVARFSLTIDGVEIAQFSELIELTSGLDPSTLTLAQDKEGTLGLKKLPGKRKPPTVTLKRAKTKDLAVFEWHHDAFFRGAQARRSCTLTMYATDGQPTAKYYLENAWPAKIEISGLKAGASEVLYETVTLVCENIERVNP
jgi:phage tail-like protein